jgi:hypothetical protein
MNQKFERIARHLYQRKYRTAPGDWTTLYCAHFVCRLKVKSRVIPLGSDESLAKDELKKIEARDVERDGKSESFTLLNGRTNTRRLTT